MGMCGGGRIIGGRKKFLLNLNLTREWGVVVGDHRGGCAWDHLTDHLKWVHPV